MTTPAAPPAYATPSQGEVVATRTGNLGSASGVVVATAGVLASSSAVAPRGFLACSLVLALRALPACSLVPAPLLFLARWSVPAVGSPASSGPASRPVACPRPARFCPLAPGRVAKERGFTHLHLAVPSKRPGGPVPAPENWDADPAGTASRVGVGR
jgi:hypothetical protein